MKVLLISSRELCYFSGSFFLDRIQEELEKICDVERVEFSETNLDALQACLEKRYDAVLDINSKLPYLVMDDGSRFLNQLQAPFYNYILDHPLYHHPGLVFPLKDYHAIAIDKRHQAYMKQYYPHLKTVEYLPLGGTADLHPVDYKDRRIDLLFAGTYLDRKMVERELQGRGQVNTPWQGGVGRFGEQDIYEISMELISKWNPDEETMEEALSSLISTEGDSEFRELMNRLYAVDRYMRNEIRTDILVTIAEAGLPLTVLGEGWENTKLALFDNVKLLPGCPMEESFRYMADSKMVLDINPLFHDGLHDRVSSAWANGAVCVTNMNPDAVPEELRDCTLFYKRCCMDELLQSLGSLSEERLLEMSRKSKIYASTYGSWSHIARRLYEIMCSTK